MIKNEALVNKSIDNELKRRVCYEIFFTIYFIVFLSLFCTVDFSLSLPDLPMDLRIIGFPKVKDRIVNISSFPRNTNYTKIFYSYWIEQNNTSYNTYKNLLSFPPTSKFIKSRPSKVIKQAVAMSSRLKYFFEARGVYITTWGLIINNETLYLHQVGKKTNKIYRIKDGNIERHLPIAIFYGNFYQIRRFYAHWVIDFILPVMKTPKPIRDSVPIIVSHGIYQSIIQMLNLIGIENERIIEFNDPDCFMYVDKLYSVTCCDMGNRFYGEPVKSAQIFFRDKLNLSRSKPTNYIFQNRNKGELRYVINWEELFNLTITTYPEYNWQIDNNTIFELYYISRFFNSILCLVSPTGSNIANVIFMQPGSVAAVIFSNWMDIPAICTCASCDVYMVLSYSPGNHWRYIPWIIDPVVFNESIGRVVKYLKKL